jgi:hypothetical protein
MSNFKHNKKRNIGIIYELLLRHMSNALIEGNKKEIKYATSLIEKRFNKKSEVYKEFRLFNALAKLNISTTEIAAAVLTESKQSCKRINSKKLEKEKSDLIRDINYNIASNDSKFYYRSIENYKDLGIIQIAINEWKKGDMSNFKKLVEIEEKIINVLSKKKKTITYEDHSSALKESKSDRLVYKIMSNKINEKYSNMSINQKKILQAYALGVKDNNYLVKILKENKKLCIKKINEFQLENDNKYLRNSIKEVKSKISKLNPVDINDKSIIKFLTVSKLIDEL